MCRKIKLIFLQRGLIPWFGYKSDNKEWLFFSSDESAGDSLQGCDSF